MIAIEQQPAQLLLRSGERSFTLRPAVSASGARYQAVDDPATGLWRKGDRALLQIDGVSFPECVTLPMPTLPLVAQGQEPGWRVDLAADGMALLADYGAVSLSFPAPSLELSAQGLLYRSSSGPDELELWLEDRLCADVATGMPHPWTASYRLNGDGHSGCGGEPRSLLMGGEWQVEQLDGRTLVEGSRLTIDFFEVARLAGTAGCNRYNAGYELTGEGLSIGPAAATRMACAQQALMEQEQRFLAVLQAVVRFELDDAGRLRLHTSLGDSITAVRSARD